MPKFILDHINFLFMIYVCITGLGGITLVVMDILVFPFTIVWALLMIFNSVIAKHVLRKEDA